MSLRLAAAFRRAERRRCAQGAPADAARLCVTDLLRLHGHDSAAVLLLVLAMLSVTPIAGVGTLLSLVILALAWRWHRGPDSRIVPQRLGQVQLTEAWTGRCLRFLGWLYAVAGRWLRVRCTTLMHPGAHAAWGAFIALMAVLILLPLPLGNVLPGASLVLLSLGWMFRDGLALLASLLLGSGAVAFALAMSHLLLASAQTAWTWLAGTP